MSDDPRWGDDPRQRKRPTTAVTKLSTGVVNQKNQEMDESACRLAVSVRYWLDGVDV